jgi:hypothetical protein
VTLTTSGRLGMRVVACCDETVAGARISAATRSGKNPFSRWVRL